MVSLETGDEQGSWTVPSLGLPVDWQHRWETPVGLLLNMGEHGLGGPFHLSRPSLTSVSFCDPRKDGNAERQDPGGAGGNAE